MEQNKYLKYCKGISGIRGFLKRYVKPEITDLRLGPHFKLHLLKEKS